MKKWLPNFTKSLLAVLLVLLGMEGVLVSEAAAQRFRETSTHSGFSVMIVGSGSPRYNARRSGPSALVRYNNKNFLVDMGNGTQARLNESGIASGKMDALMLTHHHLDHNEELIPIFINNLLRGHSFMVCGPAKTKTYIETLRTLYKEDIDYRRARRKRNNGGTDAYQIKELKGGDAFVCEGVKIRTASMNHTITTIAYRFDVGGHSIVVSGDTAYTPNLGKLAKGADILVMDSGGVIRQNNRGNGMRRSGRRNRPGEGNRASRRNSTSSKKSTGIKAHGTLEEVAKMAAEAGVKKLVLTHFGPGDVDETATKTEIRKLFKGEIIFGRDLLTIKI
ncbi:MAG: MBL fold metallo-hydrolase [bacterium]|nr:MBL fold metallo-hydrolase [bacterium]